MRACAAAQTTKPYGWLELEALLLRQLEMPDGIVRKRDQIEGPVLFVDDLDEHTVARHLHYGADCPTLPRI